MRCCFLNCIETRYLNPQKVRCLSTYHSINRWNLILFTFNFLKNIFISNPSVVSDYVVTTDVHLPFLYHKIGFFFISNIYIVTKRWIDPLLSQHLNCSKSTYLHVWNNYVLIIKGLNVFFILINIVNFDFSCYKKILV